MMFGKYWYTVIYMEQKLRQNVPATKISTDHRFQCQSARSVLNNWYFFLDAPLSSPKFSTIPREVQVYKGDNVSVECLVSGGKSVSETNITVTCPSMLSSVTVQNGDNITRTVTFGPVTNADQVNCSCRTSWKRYNWYTYHMTLSLVVFSE